MPTPMNSRLPLGFQHHTGHQEADMTLVFLVLRALVIIVADDDGIGADLFRVVLQADQRRPQRPVAISLILLAERRSTASVGRGQQLGAEDLVAGVAEARQDIALFVQAFVDGGGVDLDIRMGGLDPPETFRRGNQE